MRIHGICCAACLLIAAPGPGLAGDEEPSVLEDPSVLEAGPQDEIVTPQAEAPLRQSPPGLFFRGKGTQIGTLAAGEPYRVIEQIEVPTIVGTQRWLKVVPSTDLGQSGWAYSGVFEEPESVADTADPEDARSGQATQ